MSKVMLLAATFASFYAAWLAYHEENPIAIFFTLCGLFGLFVFLTWEG